MQFGKTLITLLIPFNVLHWHDFEMDDLKIALYAAYVVSIENKALVEIVTLALTTSDFSFHTKRGTDKMF